MFADVEENILKNVEKIKTKLSRDKSRRYSNETS